MNSGYELVRQDLDGTHSALVLAEVGKTNTFIDDMAEDYKRKDEATALKRSLVRIARYGIPWALSSDVAKILSTSTPGLLVVEIRVHRKTYRIMAYLHDKKHGPLVLLFAFKGHVQRSAGGIPKQTLEKGISLAAVAKRLLDEGDTLNIDS